MAKKDYNPRRSEITPISDAIDNLLNTYKINGRFDEASLINAWEEVMGKPVGSRTNRLFIKKDVLFVELSSAPLKHELNLSKDKILSNFKDHFGKAIVQEIVFL